MLVLLVVRGWESGWDGGWGGRACCLETVNMLPNAKKLCE
jgi:hypothetical protein